MQAERTVLLKGRVQIMDLGQLRIEMLCNISIHPYGHRYMLCLSSFGAVTPQIWYQRDVGILGSELDQVPSLARSHYNGNQQQISPLRPNLSLNL
ncbi:hypothetical protein RJT34_14717 [Clitoria ternatea]|uniref:Uncharacterized protein n=1 Tax=Clitoria ternatea TaxID=43366 RepID=A0AAN9PLC6_CLITE